MVQIICTHIDNNNKAHVKVWDNQERYEYLPGCFSLPLFEQYLAEVGYQAGKTTGIMGVLLWI